MDIDVTLVDRGRIATDVNRVVEGYRTATRSDPNPDLLYAEGPVYNLVVDHPEATVLWDTGSHPEAGDGHWPASLYEAFAHEDAAEHPLAEDLAAAGYGLDDVDAVVQTHLHADHAGGLHEFAGTDTPVYVHEEELKHAYYSAATGRGVYVRGDFDHELNWRVIHGERAEPFEGVELLHLPGHTPGVMGALLCLDRGPVLLTSDQAYVGANYRGEKPLGAGLLWSRPDWEESLRRCKDVERRHDAEVVFGHDPDQFDELRERWG